MASFIKCWPGNLALKWLPMILDSWRGILLVALKLWQPVHMWMSVAPEIKRYIDALFHQVGVLDRLGRQATHREGWTRRLTPTGYSHERLRYRLAEWTRDRWVPVTWLLTVTYRSQQWRLPSCSCFLYCISIQVDSKVAAVSHVLSNAFGGSELYTKFVML